MHHHREQDATDCEEHYATEPKHYFPMLVRLLIVVRIFRGRSRTQCLCIPSLERDCFLDPKHEHVPQTQQ